MNTTDLTAAVAALPEAPDAGATEAAVAELVNCVIHGAWRARASDIHVVPEDDATNIHYRIDGCLQLQCTVPGVWHGAVTERLKTMGALNVDDSGLPQDGRVQLRVDDHRIDLRISSLPTVQGERIAMRLIDTDTVMLDLARFRLPEADEEQLRRFCHLPNGLVLTVGPTGSGKTTLLYALLKEASNPERVVFSVEDPVEVLLPGVSQTAVRPHIGLTFSRLARGILRQDPDVIMVGEIRDMETLNVCLQAAITGHLVFSTLHTPSVATGIRRALDIGVPAFLLQNSLAGVAAQRLLRCLCPDCRRRTAVDPAAVGPKIADLIARIPEATFYEPVGCEQCHGMGYRRRLCVQEIATVDSELRAAIGTDPTAAELEAVLRASGRPSLLQRGIERAAAGETSLKEVMRVLAD